LDALAIIRDQNGVVGFRPATAASSSRKALRDHELSFSQFTFAHKRFTQYTIATKWPEANDAALCDFFMAIETHYFRELVNGEAALLEYQSRVRQEWHRTIDLDQGFAIQHINETILNECKHKADSDALLMPTSQVHTISPFENLDTNRHPPNIQN
jgi:hypothetical protein